MTGPRSCCPPPPLSSFRLSFAFRGNSCSWGFVRAGRAQQRVCQCLAEPARCRWLGLWVAVTGGVESRGVLSRSAWGESGLCSPAACTNHILILSLPGPCSSVSPSSLKWLWRLAAMGGAWCWGVLAGTRVLSPFHGECWVLGFLLRRRTVGAMAGVFAFRVWVETTFMGI